MAFNDTISLNGLIRIAGLIAANSDHSFNLVVNIKSVPTGGNFSTFWYYGDDPAVYTNYIWIGQLPTTGQIEIDIDGLDTGVIANPGLGHHLISYSRTGTTHKIYIDGVLKDTLTADISAWTITHEYVGTDTGSWLAASYQYFREWNSLLTQDQLIAEAGSPTAIISAWTDTPLVSDLLDISGNGRNWAQDVGGDTFITTPINVIWEGALEIPSLPFSDTQDAYDGVQTNPLWYYYDSASTEHEIGLFAFGDLTIYRPTTTTWIVISHIITQFLGISAHNKPLQTPVIFGQREYFKITPNAGNPNPAVVTITAQTAPKLSIPIGSYLINDDSVGFPGVALSSIDGSILNFLYPFPAGEAGDVIPVTGELLFNDFATNNLYFFDNQGVFVTTVATGSDPHIRTNLGASKFYVARQLANSTINIYLPDGTLDATHTLTGVNSIYGIAGSNDELTLYYSRKAAGSALKTWNLSGGIAGADLAAGVGSYWIPDILVLSDDTIIVSYYNSGTQDTFVRQYDSVGTILHTYSIGVSVAEGGTFPRLFYSKDEPASFGIWIHPSTGLSRILEIDIATGTALNTTDATEFESGVYNKAETATPDAEFGPSFSCPIVQLRVAITEAGVPGTITVHKTVVPSSNTTVFDFTAGGGLDPTTFSLGHDDSQFYPDIAIGDGYSIEETVNPLFTTEITVSNGSPNTNITVGDGEAVVVEVVNTLIPVPPPINAGSGIYKIIPNSYKSNDTLWTSFDPPDTEDVEIPRPFARTGLIGE